MVSQRILRGHPPGGLTVTRGPRDQLSCSALRIRPDSTARTAAWVRSLTFSVDRMRATLFLTVPAVSPSRAPISRLVKPAAIMPRMWRSRTLRCSSCAAEAVRSRRPTRGLLRFRGMPIVLGSPAAARALGIEPVYQDPAILDDLNLWRYFFIGKERSRGWFGPGVLAEGEMRAETSHALAAIVAARNRGLGVLYIDHNVSHVLQIADRVVVLTRGRVVGQLNARDTTENEVSRLLSAP